MEPTTLPRHISEVAEAEKLPVGSILLGDDDDVSRLVAFQPVRTISPKPVAMWQVMGGGMTQTSAVVLPGTLIWEPSA